MYKTVGMSAGQRLAAVLLALAVVTAGCTGGGSAPAQSKAPESNAGSGQGGGSGATLATVPEVVDKVSPSVVTVRVPGKGLGSGVVYRKNGLIVTNEHVVHGSQKVEVVFADGTQTEGTVLATDKATDLAVLRVDRKNLPVPKYADSLPEVGELAVAIGTPLGFETSVTAGVVSAVGRAIPGSVREGERALVNLIQTDAAISPGNSGGALVDGDGTVIGINDAYIPPKTGAVSIGFAIPSTTVTFIVNQLLKDGTAAHPYLGVGLHTLTPRLRKALNISAEQGVAVLEVKEDSPAAEAGVRPGDVIIRFAGRDISSEASVLGALRSTKPGQKVPMTIKRDGKTVKLTVTIGKRGD